MVKLQHNAGFNLLSALLFLGMGLFFHNPGDTIDPGNWLADNNNPSVVKVKPTIKSAIEIHFIKNKISIKLR